MALFAGAMYFVSRELVDLSSRVCFAECVEMSKKTRSQTNTKFSVECGTEIYRLFLPVTTW